MSFLSIYYSNLLVNPKQKGGDLMKKLSFILIALVLIGCAGKHQEIFREEVMETSKDSLKPGWVFKSFRDAKDGYEFSGGVTDISDYSLGVSEARAEASTSAGCAATEKGIVIPTTNAKREVVLMGHSS